MAASKQRPPAGKAAPKAQPATANNPPPAPKAQPTQTQERQTAVERRAQRAAEAKAMQQRRRTRNLLIGLAVATVVALVLGLIVRNQLALQGIGTPVADEGRGHVNETETLNFQHIPPSSGTHYPTAQPAGIYRTQEINEGHWVHSLEHGYVVALVKCTTNCGQVFDELQDIYDKTLPNSSFGNKKLLALKYDRAFTDGHSPVVTMVAWGHEMELDTVDRTKIVNFYKKFVDKGPENVP
jgi:hypothetical protein